MFTRFERRIPRRTRAALLLALGLIAACISYALLGAGIGSASASAQLGSPRALATPPGPRLLSAEDRGQLVVALGVSAVREVGLQPATPATREAAAWIEAPFSLATRSTETPSVPEPGSALLLGAGLVALGLRARG